MSKFWNVWIMTKHRTGICWMSLIFLLLKNEAISGSYNRKYTNRTLNGYHCVHGHYASFTNISRPYCTQICLRDRQCASLSFNMETDFCQLSHKPCAVAHAESGFVLMNFRMNEDENCVTWESGGAEAGGTVPERLVKDHGAKHVAVGCVQISENVHVGVIENGNGFFVVEGTEPNTTKTLIIS